MDANKFNYGSFKKDNQEERTLKIPTDVLNQSDSVALDLETEATENTIVLSRNSRCVSVDTNSFTPDGRKGKRVFRGKEDLVKFRCTVFEKKLLKIKARKSGLSLSEYIRRSIFEKQIVERMSDEHITIYKMLIKYHNNFKSIGNMYKKRNSKLTETVYKLAAEIKAHLKTLEK